MFVAEGEKLVGELLDSPLKAQAVYSTEPGLFRNALPLTERELKQASSLVHPNKVLGVFHIPQPAPLRFSEWVLALDGVQRGSRKLTMLWLGMVILLGAGFLGFQVYEFNHFVHEGLTIGTNVFGSSFFVLTGFHGAHVAGGVIWMLTLWIMAARGKLPPKDALKVEIAGLYWHFVDIVWIFLFPLLYLLGRNLQV
jgi:hypothetical protein